MHTKYDPEADAVYVYLTNDRPKRGSVKKTVVIIDQELNLDFDADGRLVGVELLAKIHPDLKVK